MKIALAHDFLIRWGGAEKVLFDLHKIFPEAPIHTLFYDKQFVAERFSGVEIKASYLQKRHQAIKKIQKIIGIKKRELHRWLLPSMPLAVESLDFSDYNLVISSSSGFMKGIIASSKTKHICYLHTPTRWAWQDYERGDRNNFEFQILNFESNPNDLISNEKRITGTRNGKDINMSKGRKGTFLKRLYIHFFRIWDFEASQRPDILITNSRYTVQRIRKYYRRKAKVAYPGVEVNHESGIMNQELRMTKDDVNEEIKSFKFHDLSFKNYFIIVSRLSAYKRVDWAIEAFKNLPYNLVIVGKGKEWKKLKRKAHNRRTSDKTSKNLDGRWKHITENGEQGIGSIFFTGFVKDKSILCDLIKNSIGLIHLAEEDFGLSILEALKLGKLVIAYNGGGARELIKEGISGEFFTNKRDLSKIIKKVTENVGKYKPAIIKKSVNKFSQKRFKKEIMEHITHNMEHETEEPPVSRGNLDGRWDHGITIP